MRILPSLELGIFGWIDTQVQANIVARQVQRISQVDLCFVDAAEFEPESTRGAAKVGAFAMQNRATMRDMAEGRRGHLQYFVLARRLINQNSHEAVQQIFRWK